MSRGPKPCRDCAALPTRLYLAGWLCALHAPPAAPTPDPANTLDGLRARRMRIRREVIDAAPEFLVAKG